MRCYRTPAGLFVATQAEAGASFSKIDFPDDKAGQINFLNALASTERTLAEGDPLAAVPADPPYAKHGERRDSEHAGGTIAPKLDRAAVEGFTLTDAETFIQSADHRQLTSLFENVVFRGRELVREGGR